MPEFIISYTNNSDLLIVVECKADVNKHESKTLDNYADYAVDGVLLYASFLSKEYDVIAIAVSGEEKKSLQISHYLHLKGQFKATPQFSNKLLTPDNYLQSYLKSPEKFNQDYSSLLSYSKTLSDRLHAIKIKTSQRSLLISGVLIALTDKAFEVSYKLHQKPEDLANILADTVINQLRNANLHDKKLDNLRNAYNFIRTHAALSKENNVLASIIEDIDNNINTFIKTYQFFDVLGQFYIEFLRYANSDKGLGIVLTPPHITEFFCELAKVNKNSIVLDNCTGTGGFLISAMSLMVKNAKGDAAKIKAIKQKQLVGIEYQDEIFALACSNMFIHDDGKTNIINDDCFSEAVISQVTSEHPNIGLLNPPYQTSKDDTEELEFVLNNLQCLQPNGTCIAIVPMACVLATSGAKYQLKKQLLESHTLEAVLSMPDELFYNSDVRVITAAIIVTAHQPHPEGQETFFGYCKEDGFVKRKNKGRIDLYNRWENFKKDYLISYRNRAEKPGVSVNKSITSDDEWCAEAYLETDYTQLKKENFERKIIDYISYKVKLSYTDVSIAPFNQQNPSPITSLDTSKWKSFKYGGINGIFNIHNGYYNKKPENTEPGSIPFIGATEYNNGITGKYSMQDIIDNHKDERSVEHPIEQKIFKGNSITVSNNGSVGFAFYQPIDFTCSHDVNVLFLKGREWNVYIAMFICAVIELERFRWTFGRKWRPMRMPDSDIKLPVTKDGKPDFELMENYIKGFAYSMSL